MSAAQKHAWFNLVIVLLCVITVVALIPVLGVQRAQGGFGILGLLGLGPLFFRKRAGVVVSDIGAVAKGQGKARFLGADGRPLVFAQAAFSHF